MRSDPPSSGQPTVVVSVVDLASLPPPPPTTDGPPELEQLSTFEPSRNRFRFDALLGEGGTGRVYAVFDEDLEREVAVKVVPRSGTSAEEAFAREARVTSSLSHPNVPPVFDVGRVAQGYYLTLPRIRGRSLRALIEEARERAEPSALPTSELVEVFLKVCDALAYAHDHGVVHQDIKPANIMIGNYGEVMLVDWGAASVVGQRHGDRPVTGTPAYMAPEQARGVTENPTLDVYALGATLFHSLLLRKPLVEKDPARFWQRKDAGELDFPTRQELSSYPRALLAIARRAMSARPVDRYASVPELAQALRDFASGGRSWSAPLVYETFTDEGWREHWRPLPEDGFVTAGGQLITRAPHAALLYFDERLSGGVAIEYEATLCADGPAGDVSVVWTEDDGVLAGPARFPKPGGRTFCFQVGALANTLVGIFQDFHRSLSSRSLRLEPGRPYRIRVEIDERLLRLSIDGEVMAEYEARAPLRSGYLALYGYFPGQAFGQVRICQRGQPESVSALAIGDAFFVRGDYEEAELEYRRVEQGHSSSEMVEAARYKRGLCELWMGRASLADALWRGLDPASYGPRIELHRAEDAAERGDHGSALQTLEKVYAEQPSYRARVVQHWREFVASLVDRDDRPLRDYLALRERAFPGDPSSRSLAARAHLALGQYEEVLARYGSERLEACDALLALGRFDELLREHSDMTGLCDATLVRQGKLDAVTGEVRSQPRVLLARGEYEHAWSVAEHAEVAVASGRYQQALAAPDAGPMDRVSALLGMGRAEEACELDHPIAWLAVGRFNEARAAARTLESRVRVLHALALEAAIHQDLGEFERVRSSAEELPLGMAWEDVWCERFVLLPLAAETLGEAGALARSLTTVVERFRYYWVQRAYWLARFVLGEIDESEFGRQPAQGGLTARLELGRALRAELAGDAIAASAAYERLMLLPRSERAIDSVYANPTFERFVAARIRPLQVT